MDGIVGQGMFVVIFTKCTTGLLIVIIIIINKYMYKGSNRYSPNMRDWNAC